MLRLIPWILTFVRPYRGRLAVLALLSGVDVALAALTPWPMKIIIDDVLNGSGGPRLLALVLAAGLAIQLLAELTDTAGARLQARAGEQITLDVRSRLFAHLEALSLRQHARLGPGDAMYRIASDAPFAATLVFSALSPLTAAVLTLAAMLIILVRIDATLAAIALGAVPFLFWLVRGHLRPLGDRSERIKALESSLADRIYETFAAIRVVKSFGRERLEQERFDARSTAAADERLALKRQETVFSLAIAVVAMAGTTAVVWIGGMHVLNGRLTVGTLLVVIFYLGAVYRPLSVIAHTTGTIQEAFTGARRVHDVMTLVPEVIVAAPDATSRARPRPGHVAFEHVTFSYEGHAAALDGASFTAAPGEIVALVGLTGAGKSTAASLIPRFYDPDAGAVLVDGVDARRHDLASLRARVALVLQEPLLFKGSIADNIRYGRPGASDADVSRAAALAEAAEFIERLPGGYDTPVGDSGGGLSGGERQQICLARALLKDAPILVLDEPTSSLDAATEARVLASLRRLRDGRTTIVVAHRLSAVQDADRIVVFDGGGVTAIGRHDEVLASSDVYRRMWERFCAS